MNIPAMKALAKELASGKYPSAGKPWVMKVSTVQNSVHFIGYSLLGVMADIYMRAKARNLIQDSVSWIEWVDPGKLDSPFILKFDEGFGEDKWRIDIPGCILKWYDISREKSTELVILQMRGFSFEQIAKAVLKGIAEWEKGGRKVA